MANGIMCMVLWCSLPRGHEQHAGRRQGAHVMHASVHYRWGIAGFICMVQCRDVTVILGVTAKNALSNAMPRWPVGQRLFALLAAEWA